MYFQVLSNLLIFVILINLNKTSNIRIKNRCRYRILDIFCFFVGTTMYDNFLVFLLINQNLIIIIFKKNESKLLKFLSFLAYFKVKFSNLYFYLFFN